MSACSQISAETIIENINCEPVCIIYTDKLNTDTTGTFIGQYGESQSQIKFVDDLLIVTDTSQREFLKGPKRENLSNKVYYTIKGFWVGDFRTERKNEFDARILLFSVKITLKVGTNKNKSGCGRWLTIENYFALWWSTFFYILIWPPSLDNSISFSAHSSRLNRQRLKVPSGQIGSAWEWYHWKAL